MFMNSKQFPLRWAPKASHSAHPGGNLEPSQGYFLFSFPTTIYRTKTAAEKNNDAPNPPRQVTLQQKKSLSTIQVIQPQLYWLHLTVFK